MSPEPLPAMTRRGFLGGTLAAAATLPASIRIAAAADPAAPATRPVREPEPLVRILFDSLTPAQRKEVCFDWDFIDKKKGLLRTRIENNWRITKPTLNSAFYTDSQRDLIRAIYEGMLNPDWVAKVDQQLKDDAGGYGKSQGIAIFGQPGTGKFEYVFTGRHITLRCDGNSADHVAFGGPIFHGHAAKGFYEKKDHAGSIFWPQALEANRLYTMLDGKQRDRALVKSGMPSEELVGFRGSKPSQPYHGLAVADMSADQKAQLQKVLGMLVEPYRTSDRDEAVACLKKQGGLDACHLAFYGEADIGEDGVWDNWRLEGPSFVWHFRGKPHVHIWVNVADSADVKLNAFQDSVM